MYANRGVVGILFFLIKKSMYQSDNKMAKNKLVRNRDDSTVDGANVIAFVHCKGGTGKTTSCLNIAGWLEKMNKKVLVVDLDPQGSATAGLGVDRNTIDSSVYDVLFGTKDIKEVILETDSGIYLVPSSQDLLAVVTHAAGQTSNMGILRKNLETIEKYFDYILIDIPPGLTLLVINGIVASENIIIPLDSGVFAYETMETLKTLALDLNEELGIEPNVMMLLLKEYSGSIFDKGITQEVKQMLEKFLTANNIPEVEIFTIPFSRKIYKAQMRGMPISHHAPHSNVGKVYKKITKAIIKISVNAD